MFFNQKKIPQKNFEKITVMTSTRGPAPGRAGRAGPRAGPGRGPGRAGKILKSARPGPARPGPLQVWSKMKKVMLPQS